RGRGEAPLREGLPRHVPALSAAAAPEASGRVCPVCASPALSVAFTAQDLAEQAALAERFHRVRLRGGAAELAERASFTQHADAALLLCAACDVLARWPPPRAAEVRHHYAE